MLRYSVFVLSLLLTSPSWAVDSLRCGTRLVYLGDSKVKVLRLCGEPLTREMLGTQTIHYGGRRGGFVEFTEPVEKWTYDAGPTRFMRELTFSGGSLVDIEFGDKP